MNRVFNKAVLVIDSCENFVQLGAASRYIGLAEKSKKITKDQEKALFKYFVKHQIRKINQSVENKRPQNGASTAKISGLDRGEELA